MGVYIYVFVLIFNADHIPAHFVATVIAVAFVYIFNDEFISIPHCVGCEMYIAIVTTCAYVFCFHGLFGLVFVEA